MSRTLSKIRSYWIPPEIRYAKAAAALRDSGFLILLWNLTPEPKYEVYQAIEEVYQAYAPSLVRPMAILPPPQNP